MVKEWTDEILDKKRELADPHADEAAAALFEMINTQDTEEKKKKVADFIREFVSHDFTQKWDQDKHEIKIPQKLLDYFEDLRPFEFSEKELKILDKGADFYLKHGPRIIFILYARSLLKQYAHTKAIEVLRKTTLLEKHAHRRIIETMQFVVDVMQPNWSKGYFIWGTHRLNKNHTGIRSIQKLRLVHAMIRYKIKNNITHTKDKGWDVKELGEPINQEDMIFATHTFSTEVIQGLQEMGAKLSPEEIENYYQTWSLIGKALGVNADLIPENYEDGCKLQQIIYDRHFTLDNKYGAILAEALVKWFADTMPFFNRKTALTVIKDANDKANQELIEKYLKLDLSEGHDDLIAHLAETDLPGMEKHKGQNKATAEIEHLFIYFIENLLKVERGGKESTFRIGDGFDDTWNINRDQENPTNKLILIISTIWTAIKGFFLKIIGYFKNHD
ncbi:oxygenase MpaB family protein [Robiginitalea sp. IMCC44478]|uniref:oxygenase MpaB family protein n=1 Tax=Robiginitalea sp. IMCC44478 TaxID=3459122 RepID=UPI0040417124